MTIRLITGVPGTGKTAFLVSELEKVAATGRKIFVDNIPGLKIEHYRAGKISEWQKGTWLHIDQYKRTKPSNAPVEPDHDEENDGNENWIPNPDVFKDESGNLFINAYKPASDSSGVVELVGKVPYESHKGALLVIDEAQRHFRPRPSGSPVPDHVAALEVHRHQGLDIWLVTQRPGLIDANVRALVGQHVALRATSLGRWKYVWPEVGDIESKNSRDNAARSRYKLPKHVFSLYKSAEVHTMTKQPMPFAAKVFFLAVPVALVLFWNVFGMISGKFHPEQSAPVQPVASAVQGPITQAVYTPPTSAAVEALPVGFEPFTAKEISGQHPYQGKQFSIIARIQSANLDIYRFQVSENGIPAFSVSSSDLVKTGYTVFPISDCSAKIVYGDSEFFATCAAPAVPVSYQPQPQPLPQPRQPLQLEPYP